MDTQFFLAANSGRGFVSRYAGFPGEGAFLHILKGGPGSGKSSFLKRIRTEAAARGLDTESILCAGPCLGGWNSTPCAGAGGLRRGR